MSNDPVRCDPEGAKRGTLTEVYIDDRRVGTWILGTGGAVTATKPGAARQPGARSGRVGGGGGGPAAGRGANRQPDAAGAQAKGAPVAPAPPLAARAALRSPRGGSHP